MLHRIIKEIAFTAIKPIKTNTHDRMQSTSNILLSVPRRNVYIKTIKTNTHERRQTSNILSCVRTRTQLVTNYVI